jgi:hypothetical protein
VRTLNSRDKVTELLKNYRSYKFAISNGIAPHDDQAELGISIHSGFGSRVPRLGGRGTWDASFLDFKKYTYVVRMIEGALTEVLDDDMQTVIKYKYLERNTLTLSQIADKMHCHEQTAKHLHKKALKELSKALMFVQVPEIINLDDKVLA